MAKASRNHSREMKTGIAPFFLPVLRYVASFLRFSVSPGVCWSKLKGKSSLKRAIRRSFSAASIGIFRLSESAMGI